MDSEHAEFQDLVHQHVINLNADNDEIVDDSCDESETEDVEIIDDLDSETEPLFGEDDDENNDIDIAEAPVVDNAECLLLCGRILRIMGDEVTCKACGKHLRSIGDEIFMTYAFKKSINDLLQDLTKQEMDQSPA